MEDGDVVVVDIGASYGGYAADITRTVPVNGRFTEEQSEIYQLVRDAQTAAEEVANPGVSASEMSRVATDVLARGLADLGLIESQWATYEDDTGREVPQYFLYYMHALSHGLGLDVHEDPYVMRNNHELLEEGMVITIEPGLYKKGSLGIRIEDDVVITNDGCESLTTFPKQLTII